MRVLQVNDFRFGGGCEVLVERTVALLREAGCDADLFVASEEPTLARNPLFYVDSRPCRRALRGRLDAFRPDVVHLHNVYHLLSPGVLATLKAWKKRSGGRVVMTAHDFHLLAPNSGMNEFVRGEARPLDPNVPLRLADLLRRRWDRRGLGHSSLKLAQHLWNYRLLRRERAIDAIVAPSRTLADALRARGLPAVHLPHPNPDPPAAPDRDATRDRPNELTLVFAGRLEPEKGLAPFLRHLPTGFPGRLELIGEGEERPALESLARDRGFADRVLFRGRLSHEGTLRHIARAHALVLPSRCLENYPLVLVEALLLGTNVLASDLGGMAEIVRDAGVGYLFDPLDPASLRRALETIARDHESGRLLDFNVDRLRRERAAEAWIPRLRAIYSGEPPLP